jgi:hypothetical protein
MMPGAWFWIMLLGLACIVVCTFAGSRLFTLTPFERALLTTVQIVLGLLIMFAGQCIGLMRVAPEDSTLGAFDAVFPFRLYGLVFKRLPKTGITVCCGAWGATAVLTAVFLIGGLDHWLTYIPSKKNDKGNQIQKTNTARP